VYATTASALDLGLIGLVRFLPALATSLIGGAVVDTYDRRRVLMLAQAVPMLATVAVLVAQSTGQVSLPLLYGIVFVTGLASSFEQPARQAILPALVPRAMFSRALTVTSTLGSLSAVTGPALGGALIALSGVELAYIVQGLLVVTGLVAMLPLHVSWTPTGMSFVTMLHTIREGIEYVRHHPVLLGAMTLDMFAVIFGGAKALLPVYAVDILHAGPAGYGLLSASLEIGAVAMAIALVAMPTPTHTGRTLLWSVAAFGLTTILFGVSRSFPLSLLLYALVGVADQLSVVMRLNTIQLSTPDQLRGRVTAVSSVFVTASNQLGMVESGLVAAATDAVFAVVSSGVACLVVVVLVAWWIPALRTYRLAPVPSGSDAAVDN
jgi:MFS family permease